MRGGLASATMFCAGVLLPAAALLVEGFTGACSNTFLDPIPTWGHVALVLAVVAANWRLQAAVRHDRAPTVADLRLAGLAQGVCVVYVATFLQTYPFMIFGVMVYGLGLLPYAPLTALVASQVDLWALRGSGHLPEPTPRLWRWRLAGVLLLALLDARALVTQMAMIGVENPMAPGERQLARTLLRTLGDEELMLRACWWNRREPAGPFPALAAMTFGQAYPTEARRTFFQVTGRDPATHPGVDPARSHFDLDFGRRWDPDQGGREVGRAVPDLWMHGSQLTGSLDPDAAVGYLEWTLRFRNDDEFRRREARALVRLPPGAVVSRLTLWVNGEPREAAFAGRGRVRAAYEKVVARSQDPVLVTTAGRDRILVQCFPVPPKGGEMQVRLGITTPLVVGPPEQAGLELPWVEASNFGLAPDLAPRVTLASRGTLTAAPSAGGGGWLTPATGAGDLRAALKELPGAVDQPHLMGGTLRPHQGARAGRVLVARDPGMVEAVAEDVVHADGTVVHQVLAPTAPARPSRLVVAVEASAPMAAHREAIAAFLAALPHDLPVALRVATDESTDRGAMAPDRPPPAPAAGPALAAQLQATPFVGGQACHPILSAALEDAAGAPGAVVLWLHGAHPFERDWVPTVLDRWQATASPPALWHLQLTPGANYALRDLEAMPWLRSLARSGDPDADLAALADELAGRRQLVRATRTRVAPAALAAGVARKESGMHLVRLWVNDEVLRRLGEEAMDPAPEGVAPPAPAEDPRVRLAHDYRLVTPVSGAVVLETQQQYDEAGLDPSEGGPIPSVPEPSSALLLLVVGGALGMRRRDDEAA